MSIKLDELASLLDDIDLTPAVRKSILQQAEQLEEEKKQEREENKLPKSKNQFVVVVKTHVEISDEDIVAHVFQIPQEYDPNNLLGDLVSATTDHNLSQKRKKNVLEEFDDVTKIKRAFLKPKNIHVKTKDDWTRVVVLPKDFKLGKPQEW
jgi:hypothetical protein